MRGELASEGIGFDTALVTLELAVLYAEAGRTAEVKALAALTLFRQAAEKEAVTAQMAASLLGYLRRAQHDPGLRFENL